MNCHFGERTTETKTKTRRKIGVKVGWFSTYVHVTLALEFWKMYFNAFMRELNAQIFLIQK